jgi:hypothetical protein
MGITSKRDFIRYLLICFGQVNEWFATLPIVLCCRHVYMLDRTDVKYLPTSPNKICS